MSHKINIWELESVLVEINSESSQEQKNVILDNLQEILPCHLSSILRLIDLRNTDYSFLSKLYQHFDTFAFRESLNSVIDVILFSTLGDLAARHKR